MVVQPDVLQARGLQGHEPTSQGVDQGGLGRADLAIVVGGEIVLFPRHVDVGADRLDCLGAEAAGGHRHMIHARQGGQGLRPQILVEQRPRPAAEQIGVGRDRHDQQATQLPGLLQVADRADVQQIERAVRVHDRTAFRPPPVQSPGKRLDGLDLAGLRRGAQRHGIQFAVDPDGRGSFQGHENLRRRPIHGRVGGARKSCMRGALREPPRSGV